MVRLMLPGSLSMTHGPTRPKCRDFTVTDYLTLQTPDSFSFIPKVTREVVGFKVEVCLQYQRKES